MVKPLILLILDGWGHSNKYHGNAIKQSYTPNIDFLYHHYPITFLNASDKYVGLPRGQMGNSEVGHTTIGAGRTINQELVRISNSINNGDFFTNKILQNIYQKTCSMNKTLHLIGLCSNGGVHSHIDHLYALLEMSAQYKKLKTCIHIITDGRDTRPKNAKDFIKKIQSRIVNQNNIQICTISGRYYSMDRDCRWSRTQKAYECLINDNINTLHNNIDELVTENYQKDVSDEFILPTRIKKGKINEGDGIIFFNFRPDRIRQLVQSFCNNSFQSFPVTKFNKLNIATFTNYDSTLNLPIAFPKISQTYFLGQIISEYGLKQFRLAETEKYAHVTYFFNGGREEPFPGENRQLIPSPSVDLYDLTPEMSCEEITNQLIKAIKQNTYQVIIANYANPDMLGHTGNLLATKRSIEIVDQCLFKLLKATEESNATLLITADHGNAEEMIDKYDQPCKSHTSNLVPFIFIANTKNSKNKNKDHILKPIGSLSDIAPTILDLLDIPIPYQMNGKSLFEKNIQVLNLKNN